MKRSRSRRTRALLPLLVACAWARSASAATGEEMFIKSCAACHMIGAGPLIGPDLKDIGKRRPEEWLLRFVKSPGAALKAGDPVAVALFNEFGLLMPDIPYGDDELRQIFAFIAMRSAGLTPPAPTAPPAQIGPTQETPEGERAEEAASVTKSSSVWRIAALALLVLGALYALVGRKPEGRDRAH